MLPRLAEVALRVSAPPKKLPAAGRFTMPPRTKLAGWVRLTVPVPDEVISPCCDWNELIPSMTAVLVAVKLTSPVAKGKSTRRPGFFAGSLKWREVSPKPTVFVPRLTSVRWVIFSARRLGIVNLALVVVLVGKSESPPSCTQPIFRPVRLSVSVREKPVAESPVTVTLVSSPSCTSSVPVLDW